MAIVKAVVAMRTSRADMQQISFWWPGFVSTYVRKKRGVRVCVCCLTFLGIVWTGYRGHSRVIAYKCFSSRILFLGGGGGGSGGGGRVVIHSLLFVRS